MLAILKTAWDRFQLVGQVNGEYVARLVTFVFYFSVLIPFALIARLFVDPLEIRNKQPQWHVRKAVSSKLEDARSQF